MRTLRGRHKGREKVRKYGVTYTFIKQSEIKAPEGDEDEMGEETCTVRTVAAYLILFTTFTTNTSR